MEVSYSNELSQKQTLNAQLLHSLSILRMNAQELRDYIHTLSMENPMVELVTPPQRATPASADCPAFSGALPDLRHSQTLTHELQAQAMSLPCSRPVRQMLELLIHSVNDSGYLSAPLEELTPAYCPAETAQQALRLLQQMEPAGVGARNLSECILLQLQRLPDSSLACKIAGSALPLLAEKQTAAICRMLHCTQEQVAQAAALILQCNPKPGNGYRSAAQTPFLIPDLYVYEDEPGVLRIALDETICPYIQIDPFYQSLTASETDAQTVRYLKEKLQEASSAIRHIARRNLTMMQCAQSIVQLQESFFREGLSALHPLSLSDVAAHMDVAESTVSRAVQGKYFRCKWGLFPLRLLIQRASVSAISGEEVGSDTIRKRISEIVSGEDKAKPLSDQKITERLCGEGYLISRRTVAKYREQLQILPAAKRKLL